MKKVRIALKTLPYAGRYGTYRPHSLLDVDVDEAKALVDAGHAIYVGKPPTGEEIETAMKKPIPQKAIKAKAQPKLGVEFRAEPQKTWLERLKEENDREDK